MPWRFSHSFSLIPPSRKLQLSSFIFTSKLFSVTDMSVFQNVRLSWFLCTSFLPVKLTHRHPHCTALHSWGLNACISTMSAVVYIYSYDFWLNCRFLRVLSEKAMFSQAQHISCFVEHSFLYIKDKSSTAKIIIFA